MSAICRYYDLEESIEKAFNASTNILLFSNRLKNENKDLAKNVHSIKKNW